MSDLYIYTSSYQKETEDNEKIERSVTIIFCGCHSVNEMNVQSEIKEFYYHNYQTDEIIIIGGNYDRENLELVFILKQSDTFKYIPKLEPDHLSQNIHLLIFDKNGKLSGYNNDCSFDILLLKKFFNDGLVNIFNKRGGLIEANGDAHHFVFPSGKHCNKFLRTGNILMNSAEIYFIAFCLLDKFKEEEHQKIYCDTSSINTLAFALLDLKRKLIGDTFSFKPIVSFSSYDGLFSNKIKFYDSLVLISSSTSGNIIERIIKHDDSVDLSNIVILYYLGTDKEYLKSKSNIVCNLTYNEDNSQGIKFYETYLDKECVHCKSGSYPVEIKGDVFLLEKPKINRITLTVNDAPKRMAEFIDQFKATKKLSNKVFKVNYKENREPEKKYDIYFDIHYVLSTMPGNSENKLYTNFYQKFYDFINQYIPSNTKYLIALPDEGSQKLADIIQKHIKEQYKEEYIPDIINFEEVENKITDNTIVGAAVIIGSCIANGKNLLFLSRALRNFNRLKLIYFIGLARTSNETELESLKKNLKQGNYGKDTNSFIAVETFFLNKDNTNTTWLNEIKLIKNELFDFADKFNLTNAKEKLKERYELLIDSLSEQTKGLANKLFYPDSNNIQLQLRKGYAFFPALDKYFENVSQADVYVSISIVLNNLRHQEDYKHCLKQSEFVRNLIDPYNFNRFNDGIIQASILRSAKQSELSYHIDEELSNDMYLILEKIVEEYKTLQGEGLLEFLYAIASTKLTLRKDKLEELVSKLETIKGNNALVDFFSFYIKEKVIQKKQSLQEMVSKLEKENEELKAEILKLKPKKEMER